MINQELLKSFISSEVLSDCEKAITIEAIWPLLKFISVERFFLCERDARSILLSLKCDSVKIELYNKLYNKFFYNDGPEDVLNLISTFSSCKYNNVAKTFEMNSLNSSAEEIKFLENLCSRNKFN
jgi:hypothetical protein